MRRGPELRVLQHGPDEVHLDLELRLPLRGHREACRDRLGRARGGRQHLGHPRLRRVLLRLRQQEVRAPRLLLLLHKHREARGGPRLLHQLDQQAGHRLLRPGRSQGDQPRPPGSYEVHSNVLQVHRHQHLQRNRHRRRDEAVQVLARGLLTLGVTC